MGHDDKVAQAIADLSAGLDLADFMSGVAEGVGMVFASVDLPQDEEFSLARALAATVVAQSDRYKNQSSKEPDHG